MHYKHYTSKSHYPYWVVKASEDLTKFHVWSKIKTFNCTLYSEERVLKLIEEKYPGAVRVDWVNRSRRPTKVANLQESANADAQIQRG